MGMWVLVHILMLVKVFSGGRSESKADKIVVRKESADSSDNITFRKVGKVDFLPYDGEVEVFYKPYDPPGASVLVGYVYSRGEGSKDVSIEKMKTEAAKYGADKLIFFRNEPDSLYRSWSAQAFNTRDAVSPVK